GHLHSNAVISTKDVGGGPELYLDRRHPISPTPPGGRRHTHKPVADVAGFSRGLDVTEPHEEIRVLQRGPRAQIGGDRTDHGEVADQRGAGVDKDVAAPLEVSVVARPSRPGEQAAPDRGRRVRRVIPVPVRSRDLRGARVQPASRLKMPADAARRGWPLVGIEPSADTADEQADPRAAWAAPTVEKVPAEPVERVAQALAGETGV